MKKLLIAVLGIAMIAMASTQSRAASNWVNYNITVTIVAGENLIETVDTPETWGILTAGGGAVFSNNTGTNPFDGQPRMSVRNVGSSTIDLQVRSHVGGTISFATTGVDAAAVDVATLAAVYTAQNSQDDGAGTPYYMLLNEDFGVEDLLPSDDTFVSCSVGDDNTLGINTHAGPGAKGYSVATMEVRHLRFRFLPPTSITTPGDNTIYVDMRIVGTI
ncbi:hypothetical protein KAR34_09350 [bacterium]|nr:hypothetical protein [bacterium]